MRVLVTGATGRIGSRLVPRLLRHSTVSGVRALVRHAERAGPLAAQGVELAVGDVRDGEARRSAVAGVDAIVHLAASLRGVDPESMPAVNLEATTALARDALAAGVRRFVHISTNLVYGNKSDRPFVEDDPLAPTDEYGVYPHTKAQAEAALQELHAREGLPLRVLRLAFVYGEGDPHLAESLRWATTWARHHRLHMVHHADVGQAVLRVLATDGVDGRVYNVADDAPVTAVELFELNGLPVPPEPTTMVEHPWDGIVSTRRIRDELGFRPVYPTAWSAWHAGAL